MKEISILTVLIVRIAVVGSIFIVASVFASITPPQQYELISRTDSTTHRTGSISLECRDAATAEAILRHEVEFFLNGSSVYYLSILWEREDDPVVAVGCCGVRFNLTRRLEGYYTCGRRVNATYVEESPPVALICK